MTTAESIRERTKDKPSRPAALGWVVVTLRELSALWRGGRLLILLIPFSMVLSAMSYLLATNNELNLIPPKEMVLLVLQTALAVSILISLIIGANAVSGMRENGTLETLLVTPVSRRQIILGKYLAALSPWPVIWAICIPYSALLAPDVQFLWYSLFVLALVGTLLVLLSAGFGLLVSIYSNSNKSSLSISLVVLLLSLSFTQLPGTTQTGNIGRLFKRINPMESSWHFMEKVLVNNRTIAEMTSFTGPEGNWLLSPLLLTGLVLLLLFAHRHKLGLEGKLDLEAMLGLLRKKQSVSVIILFVLAGAFLIAPTQALAAEDVVKQDVQISIDRSYEVRRTGEIFNFTTRVKNNDSNQSAPLVVAMNIINLGSGQPVDPEDWSPERLQALDPLKPGQTSELHWEVDPILEGDYLVYMVLAPKPVGKTTTSQPVTTPAIHLTVNQYTWLNPGNVLPIAIGMPIGLTAVWLALRALRRREIEGISPTSA
jgi:ABC-type transport system involved in multi-copper enzyme maturation permease subunit